jgi:hypothetical protein
MKEKKNNTDFTDSDKSYYRLIYLQKLIKIIYNYNF